jgi:hypothetical protein
MFKRYRPWPLYLLLILLPIQSIAAANMLICNSVQQLGLIESHQTIESHQKTAQENMPCHAVMDDKKNAETAQNDVKNHCGIICSNLLTAPNTYHAITLGVHANTVPYLISATKTYSSITLPTLQRPPIFLA